MTTNKKFTIVGTSQHNGQLKVRWANDMVTRFKILNKGGHTSINLHNLPGPMTKIDAMTWLVKESPAYEQQSADVKFVITSTLAEYIKKPVSKQVIVPMDILLEVSKRPVIKKMSKEKVDCLMPN